MKIMIGIPAYNEEKNIGSLLNDILRQDINAFIEIVVVSDHSTDQTDKIVSSFSEKNKNVRLIRREKRMGKSSALNLLFRLAKEFDFLVLLDADIRLNFNTLNIIAENICNKDVHLIAGNPIPVHPKSALNIAEQASYFSWILLNEIKGTFSNSLYCAHGRILALSSRLYNNMTIPQTVNAGNDQYIYLFCIDNKLKFEYVPDAKVFYKLPRSINDYIKQNNRFIIGISEKKKIFKEYFMKNHISDEKIYRILIKSFASNPYKGLCWSILYIAGRLSVIFKKSIVSRTWECDTTK